MVKYVIDYLNWYTLLLILKDKPKLYIIYKNRYLSSFYEKILKIFKIEYSYINISYGEDQAVIYKKIKEKKEKIIKNYFSFSDNLLAIFLHQKFYYDMIHHIVEIDTVIYHKIGKVEKLIVSFPNFLNDLRKNDLDIHAKIHSYFTIFHFIKKANYPTKQRHLFFNKNKFLFSKLILIFKLFILRIGNLPKKKYKLMLFSRPNKTALMDEINFVNKLNISYFYLNPVTKEIYVNGLKSAYLYSIKIEEILIYFRTIWEIYKSIKIQKRSPFLLKIFLLVSAKDIYFVNKLNKELECEVVYTCFEGSILTHIINILAYQSQNIISINSTWSLNYIPEFYTCTHKNCDIFCSWGDIHTGFYTNGFAKSNSIIETGYIGDYAIKQMIKDFKEKYLENDNIKGKKLIAVYDNLGRDDFLFSHNDLRTFYLCLLDLCKKHEDYYIIFKTKKNAAYSLLSRDIISELSKYENKQLSFIETQADLGPAMCADLVIGISMSSPVSVAAAWGKKTLLFDNSNSIETEFSSIEIAKNEIDFKDAVEKLIIKDKKENIREINVDKFVDGKAQLRIAKYIELLISFEGLKIDKIHYANKKYQYL